jgi:hypothetical protein
VPITTDVVSSNLVWQLLATGQWFSRGPPVSSTNKTDRHDITEILLEVALNNIKPTNQTIPYNITILCSIFDLRILMAL